MGFDIKQNNLSEKAETGYEFEVKLPDGTSTDFFITVRGTMSPVVKKYSKELFNKQQVKELQLKRKGKTNELIDLDELEETVIETAVVRILTWRGLEEDGDVVPFSKEAAIKLMTEHAWIREQVMDQSDDAANFI